MARLKDFMHVSSLALAKFEAPGLPPISQGVRSLALSIPAGTPDLPVPLPSVASVPSAPALPSFLTGKGGGGLPANPFASLTAALTRGLKPQDTILMPRDVQTQDVAMAALAAGKIRGGLGSFRGTIAADRLLAPRSGIG